MNSATVITVNPSSKPLGELTPDLGLESGRVRVMAIGRDLARQKSGKSLNMIFGETSKSVGLSGLMVLVRLVIGSLIGYEGIGMLLNGGELSLAILMICGAVSLTTGTFTRIICGIVGLCMAMICLDVTGITQLNVTMACFSAVLATFAFVGPGRYSVDYILRRMIFRAVHRRQTRRLLDNRFSYQIYSYAHL